MRLFFSQILDLIIFAMINEQFFLPTISCLESLSWTETQLKPGCSDGLSDLFGRKCSCSLNPILNSQASNMMFGCWSQVTKEGRQLPDYL